ncbi:MAG: hypothetical protein HYS87_00295 [Candidatus Colwellbacteria bacterium]|nr:hypothetical protein [Candidatus Colwellbacteria bacterium]
MRGSTKRLISIMGSFAILVVTIYVFSAFLRPSYADVQVLRGERDARLVILSQQQSAESAVRNLLAAYQGAGELEEAFTDMLPKPNANVPQVLNQLSGMASANNMVFESASFQYTPIKQSDSSIVSGLGTLRITTRMNGRYDGLKGFLDMLEHNLRVMDINSLRIDGGALPGREIFAFTIVVDAYYQER